MHPQHTHLVKFWGRRAFSFSRPEKNPLSERKPHLLLSGMEAPKPRLGGAAFVTAQEQHAATKLFAPKSGIKETSCTFYFVRADFLRDQTGRAPLPKFQEIRRRFPGAMTERSISMSDVVRRTHVHDILTVSHRWLTSEASDPEGVQLTSEASDPEGVQYL